MTGVGEGLSIWGERDLTADRGTTDLDSRRSRPCVDSLNQSSSSDDQDGLSIPAEPDSAVVFFITPEKPGTGWLFRGVYAQISAGDSEQVLIGTKLEIIQGTAPKIDLPRGGTAPLVPDRDLAL
jgi:hypothetical protein